MPCAGGHCFTPSIGCHVAFNAMESFDLVPDLQAIWDFQMRLRYLMLEVIAEAKRDCRRDGPIRMKLPKQAANLREEEVAGTVMPANTTSASSCAKVLLHSTGRASLVPKVGSELCCMKIQTGLSAPLIGCGRMVTCLKQGYDMHSARLTPMHEVASQHWTFLKHCVNLNVGVGSRHVVTCCRGHVDERHHRE